MYVGHHSDNQHQLEVPKRWEVPRILSAEQFLLQDHKKNLGQRKLSSFIP